MTCDDVKVVFSFCELLFHEQHSYVGVFCCQIISAWFCCQILLKLVVNGTVLRVIIIWRSFIEFFIFINEYNFFVALINPRNSRVLFSLLFILIIQLFVVIMKIVITVNQLYTCFPYRARLPCQFKIKVLYAKYNFVLPSVNAILIG